MLLSEEFLPFDSEDYLFELKFDGTRALIYAGPDNITIKNKRGFILNDVFPELLSIQNNIKHKCIFDGEIIVMDEGKPSFNKLQERSLLKNSLKINYLKESMPACFVAFDILYEDEDLTHLPLIKRKRILDKYDNSKVFVKSKYVLKEGIKLFKLTKKKGLEGIVAKKRRVYTKLVNDLMNGLKLKIFRIVNFILWDLLILVVIQLV